jgi:hypothetical protein
MLKKDVREALINTLSPGLFYTKKTIDGVLSNHFGSKVSDTMLKSVLQDLRKGGFIEFNRSNQLWNLKERDVKKKSDLEVVMDAVKIKTLVEPIINTKLKVMIPAEIKSALSTIKFADPKIVEETIIDTIEKIATRIITTKLVEELASSNEKLIITAVKQTVKEEFKLNIVPVLLTNIKDRINQELSDRVGDIVSQLKMLDDQINSIKGALLVASSNLEDALSL